MTKYTSSIIQFPALKSRKVDLYFVGGNIISACGAVLLRQMDRKLGLTNAISCVIPYRRNQNKIVHFLVSLLRQRIYGLALGYEDLNDHQEHLHDSALQVTVGQTKVLESSPTLCRLDNRSNRQVAVDIHKVMADQFIASFRHPPKQLILDFDATDDLVHGEQEERFFHGYYGNYCFLPS